MIIQRVLHTLFDDVGRVVQVICRMHLQSMCLRACLIILTQYSMIGSPTFDTCSTVGFKSNTFARTSLNNFLILIPAAADENINGHFIFSAYFRA